MWENGLADGDDVGSVNLSTGLWVIINSLIISG